MKSGSKSHGKNLIKNIIAQVNMIVVLINIVFNAEHRSNFGKIKVGLIKQTLMDGLSGILGTVQVEDHQMIEEN